MSAKIEYCNWEFRECSTPKQKWELKRDCEGETITITRGSGKNWRAYELSLQSRYQGQPPLGECPKCGKYVNGVNPYDDGETWRR